MADDWGSLARRRAVLAQQARDSVRPQLPQAWVEPVSQPVS